jgi:uncharacterized repeat protein (TIGR01451 family)
MGLFLAATTAFGQEGDNAVAKSGPAQAAADTDVSYTVTISALGTADGTNITLKDSIPAGTVFVSATQNSGPAFSCTDPSPGDASGMSDCSLALLPAGTSAEFTFTYHIDAAAPAGSFITNVATIASPEDPNDENNAATAVTVIPGAPQSDASITKSGPSSAAPDTDVSYTISVTNAGPDAAATLSWSDLLPGTMTFVSLTQNSDPAMSCITPAGGSGGTISCSATDFPAAATATFTLVGHIPADTPAGTTFHNTATVKAPNDPAPENDASSTELTIASVDLSIIKSGPGTATAGTPYSYMITVANAGPDAATDVSWSDALPPQTTFVSLVRDSGPVAACNTPAVGSNDTVSCSWPALASGDNAHFTLTVVAGDTPSVTNTAIVGSSSFDTNNINNSSGVTTTITPVADLTITKNGPTAVTAGNDITYTISVVNNGPTAASSVTITDTLPANTTFVSAGSTSGPAATCGESAGTVTCTIASFPNAATATLSFVFHVAPSATNGTQISNTANVSATTNDPNGGNNSSTTTATVAPTADLAITKSGPSTVTIGSNATYTVVVTNNGPSDAANVTLTDTLPPNTTFVSANQTTGPSFNCSNTTTTITCTIASFAAGASASFSFVVNVTSNAQGQITNSATVSSTTADPTPGNSSASATAAVTGVGGVPTLSPLALALLSLALAFAGALIAQRP